jgi:leader peptidase (prepilin peptidase)/N-methyltransferase
LFETLFFFLGACFGSFGNVVIYRWPQKLSVVRPGSFCYSCKKPVAFYDNIPILSYFILRGKCRHCLAPFSARYAIVEFLCGLIFLILYLMCGLTPTLAEYLILSWGMLIASVIDLDHRLLPDVLTLPGIIIGLLGAWLNPEREFVSAVYGVVAGGRFLNFFFFDL